MNHEASFFHGKGRGMFWRLIIMGLITWLGAGRQNILGHGNSGKSSWTGRRVAIGTLLTHWTLSFPMSGLIANPTGQFQDPLCQRFPELVLETPLNFPLLLPLEPFGFQKPRLFTSSSTRFRASMYVLRHVAISLSDWRDSISDSSNCCQKCIFISLLLQVFHDINLRRLHRCKTLIRHDAHQVLDRPHPRSLHHTPLYGRLFWSQFRFGLHQKKSWSQQLQGFTHLSVFQVPLGIHNDPLFVLSRQSRIPNQDIGTHLLQRCGHVD